MAVLKVLDRKGHALQNVQYVDESFYPVFPFASDQRQHIRDIQELEIREDDIFIWSYLRCGNHWVWEMIRMLLKGHVEYDKNAKEEYTIDYMTPAMLENMASPRPLNSHLHHRHLPRQIFQKKTKTIVLHRDPKDVAVSYYNYMSALQEPFSYDGEFSDYLELYLEGTLRYGSWFAFERDVLQSLELHPDQPVLHVFYEDMIEDCCREVRKITAFLGLSVSDVLCQAVAEACQFKKLKGVINGRPHPLPMGWKKGVKELCRTGVTGEWKKWFSAENKELHDKVFAKKLPGTMVAYRYLQ